MIQSGIYLEHIIESLNKFSAEINSLGKVNLLNQHIHAESFMRGILNFTFGLNLQHLNGTGGNCAGLDLGDEADSGIAFQISSESHAKKINNTLETCVRQKHYLRFSKIKIFILSRKQKRYSNLIDTQQYFSFDVQRDILDFDDLFGIFKHMDLQKLRTLDDLVSRELSVTHSTPEQPENQFEDLPKLILNLSNSFTIEMNDTDVETYLIEAFSLLSENSPKYHSVILQQEEFFLKRIFALKSCDKTSDIRREIVQIKLILRELTHLKNQIGEKLRIFYLTDKFPLSNNFSDLTRSWREIVEKLSFPDNLVEDTTYVKYYPLKKIARATKFDGDIKYDIFRRHESGEQLSCSVWLTREEILEIKNKEIYFEQVSAEEFFKSHLQFFSFTAAQFNVETLVTKVIPSFVDRFYDFHRPQYGFIKSDDISWTELTNYDVGLG